MTDLGAATALAEVAAAAWGFGPPELIRSAMNAIFVVDDRKLGSGVILRIGTPSAPAEVSLHLAEHLRAHGIVAPQPVRSDAFTSGELSATAWERIPVTERAIDWRGVGRLVRMTHELDAGALPDGYPLPRPVDFPWWNFAQLFSDVSELLDPVARAGIEQAIARWPNWADDAGSVVCHGDVHPGNVLMTADGPMLIDWDLLCWAPPGWDHAPMMTWHERWGGTGSEYRDYAAGYGRSMSGVPSAEAFAELRLVAATLMRLKAAGRDEAARPEAERRLAYWRGEIDAPMWQAQ